MNTLIEISIYAAIIFAATMLVKKLFRDKMSPVLHYVVWLVLIVRLLMPVTLASPVHLFTIPAQPQSQAAEEIVLPDSAMPAAVPETSADRAGTADIDTATQQTGSQGSYSSDAGSTPAAVQRHSSMSVTQIIMTVWLVGVGVSLLYLAGLYAALRKKFKRNAARPSKRLAALFEETKAQMGIKAEIKLVCQYEYGSPALMFPKTILMPVDALVAMDDEQAKLALRHELMHYKRGDHIVSILLSLLNAVYWFNPFVWLAVRQIRMDMETACDGAVIKNLNSEGRSRYASLIVKLFAQPRHRQLVLGMAQTDARKAAEQRVRGMFMKSRSGRKTKLVCAMFAAVLLVSCFTTACQPTPEEPVVVGKGEFEDIIKQEQTESHDDQAPAIAEPYAAPESWTESIDMKGSDIEVNVDAVITVPDVSAYPVYEVAKYNFTQQQIDDIMDYFVQDKVIMQAPEMTKADYQELLIEAKRGQFIDGEYVVNEGSLAWVKEVEEMIRNAPETSEPQVVTNRSIEGDGFGGAVVLENGKYGSVFASERMFDYCSAGYPVPESQKLDMYGTGIEGEMNISEQEAVEKAQELFSELGISNMKAVDIEKAELISRTGIKIDVETPKLESKGYFIKFALSIDGIDTVLVEGGRYRKEDTFDYSAPWTPEWVHVYVGENGDIGYFNWKGPLKLTEKVSENVTLKSFEDIQERIRAQMLYECGFYEESHEKITVTVDSIEMKMTLVSVKNEPNKAMYVPSWYIYYTVTRHGDFTDESGEKKSEWPSEERLVLNAIDGGVVLPFRVPTDLSDVEDVAVAEDEIAESIG